MLEPFRSPSMQGLARLAEERSVGGVPDQRVPEYDLRAAGSQHSRACEPRQIHLASAKDVPEGVGIETLAQRRRRLNRLPVGRPESVDAGQDKPPKRGGQVGAKKFVRVAQQLIEKQGIAGSSREATLPNVFGHVDRLGELLRLIRTQRAEIQCDKGRSTRRVAERGIEALVVRPRRRQDRKGVIIRDVEQMENRGGKLAICPVHVLNHEEKRLAARSTTNQCFYDLVAKSGSSSVRHRLDKRTLVGCQLGVRQLEQKRLPGGLELKSGKDPGDRSSARRAVIVRLEADKGVRHQPQRVARMPGPEIHCSRDDRGESCCCRDFDYFFNETALADSRLSPQMNLDANLRVDAAAKKGLDLTQFRLPANEGIDRLGLGAFGDETPDMNGAIYALCGKKTAVLQVEPVGELPCKTIAYERLVGLRRARHSGREVDGGANDIEGRPLHAADNRLSGGEPDMRLKLAA